VRERPVQMSPRNVLLHNAVAEVYPNPLRSLYLTTIGSVPVHLTKGYVGGAATSYNGLLHVVKEGEEPRAVLTMGVDPCDKPNEEFKVGRQSEVGIDEGQPPPHPPDKTSLKPEADSDGVPGTLRGAVDDLLEEYKALWAGQLVKIDVTPHWIEVTPGARPWRAQPYVASHSSRNIIAKDVQRQRDLGFIKPLSAQRALPVVLVPMLDCDARRRLRWRFAHG